MKGALSISLNKLKDIGAIRCDYDKLKEIVDLLTLKSEFVEDDLIRR